MNRFIIAEPQNCIGCRTCEVACALAHPVGQGDEALSVVNFHPRLTVIVGAKVSTPVMCRHCVDAPCANACPSNAIVYRDDSVQVLQERCVGCKTCMVACPYGAMQIVTTAAKASGAFFTSRTQKAHALKCDLCADHSAGPACVTSCPTNALHLVDRNQMENTLRKRQQQAALDTPQVTI